MSSQPTIRFAAIGLNHGHIYGQTNLLLRAGAELVSFYAPEPDLVAQYSQTYPQARLARSQAEILEDQTIQLVISAGIPCERAPLGIEVMRHGKDYMSDKPGFTTLDQLAEVRQVQAETGRIYSICFSERFEVAGRRQGGRAGQGGRHRQGRADGRAGAASHPPARPPGLVLSEGQVWRHPRPTSLRTRWISSCSTPARPRPRSSRRRSAISSIRSIPELEDFGDMVLRGDGGTGYIRVDWYTPQGLGVWGDGRLTILGTEGYIELRKYIDIAGRPGRDHLFLVDQKGIQYMDCSQVELPYGRQLIADILNRTETAMPQAHCFLASQLALEAEAKAARLGNLK